jgi:hypothetical protein
MKLIMKTPVRFFLLMIVASSLACQFLAPSRPGKVISDCSAIVLQVSKLQVGEILEYLWTTGKKSGDEFDVNQYFNVLTHISMRDGYILDYVYQIDSLGGYPLLYPRPVDQAAYASAADFPEDTEWPDFQKYLNVEDTERGYFDFVVMDIMANQFYLFWHANYNDTQIVCNRQQLYDIVAQVSTSDFGNSMDPVQRSKARTLRNIVPVVNLTGEVAVVEFVTFTKWGGFYRQAYTISREVPHTILDVKQENILPYDCGIMF